MAPSKKIRMSNHQKQYLLDYMIQNPMLSVATHRGTGSGSRSKAQEMWEELARVLNDVDGGANKDIPKWKLSWLDWKLNTRNKAKNLARYERGEADGEALPTKLSSMEEKLMLFLEDEARMHGAAADCDFVEHNIEEIVYSYESSMDEISATIGADNVLVYKVDMESEPTSGPDTPDVGGVQRVRPGSDLHMEDLPTSAATGPVTPDACGIKRKMSVTNVQSQPSFVKRRPPADHTSYAHPNEHAAVLRQIQESLKDLYRTELRKAAANERRVAASERIATATERKAAASERRAAAFERIAAAKEHKYCVRDSD